MCLFCRHLSNFSQLISYLNLIFVHISQSPAPQNPPQFFLISRFFALSQAVRRAAGAICRAVLPQRKARPGRSAPAFSVRNTLVFRPLPQDFHKNRTGEGLPGGSGCTRPARAFSFYCAVFSARQTGDCRVLAFPCETAPNAGN